MIKYIPNSLKYLGLLTLGFVGAAGAYGQAPKPKPQTPTKPGTSQSQKKPAKLQADTALLNRLRAAELPTNLNYLNLNQLSQLGAISTIAPGRLKDLSAVSVDALLQAQISGVHVVNTSGAPGSGALTNIRGIATLNAGATPLYVIDGVPVKSMRFPNPLTPNADNNPLTDINPADISSISVLKDAYSTAPYGMRGANGVVIIDTYGGTSGKTLLDFSATVGFLNAPKTLDVLNAAQYRNLLIDEETSRGQTTAQINSGIGKYLLLSTPPDQVPRYNNDTDWQNEVLDNAVSTDYHLLLRGGDAVAKYSVNVGYTNQDGVLKTSNYNRFSTRFNLDYKVGRKLSVLNSISFIRSNRTLKDEGNTINTNPLYLASIKNPTLTSFQRDITGKDLRDPDSSDFAGRNNPYATIYRLRNQSASNRITARVTGQYVFSRNLNLRVGFAADYDGLSETRFVPSAGIAPVRYALRYSSQTNDNELMLLNENVLSFEKASKSGDHSISAYLGNSFQNTTQDTKYIKTVNSTADQFTINTTDPTFIDSVASASPTWRLISFFAGTQYNYKGKYTLGANVRADGSSRFAQGHQWGYFPAVAASWHVSREAMFQNIGFLSDLNARVSYGLTGNQEVGYYNGYNSLVSSPFFNFSGVKIGILGNKDFTWERTRQFDAGLDLAFLKNRLNFTIDYYNKTTDHLLNAINLPQTSGFTTYAVSDGSVSNKGLELALSAKIKIGKLAWQPGLTWSFNQNQITSMPSRSDSVFSYGNFSTLQKPGIAIGSFYGFNAIGVYDKTSSVMLKNGAANAVPFKGGDIIFEDLNHDGIIDASDRKVIGNTNPKFFGGFNNSFFYRSFEISVFMDFASGNQVFNAQRESLESMSGYDNQSTSVLSRWRNEGDITAMPRLQYGDPTGNNRFSSRWIEDGSYIRFKAVTVGYTLPLTNEKLKSVFKSVRITLTGQNLYTFSHYKGYGPEVGSAVNQIMYGADYASLPQLRSYFLGIKLGL